MNKILTVERRFTPEDKEKYFLIPFEVPENAEKLKISFTTDITEGICIDLGLVYPDGRQCGASGGRTREIEISARWATPGYEASQPLPGIWNIIAGVYRPCDGVTATYTIELILKERRWLSGDTHVHTFHSDGSLSPENVLRLAEKKKLDYLIFTDHNNTAVAAKNITHPDITVIKGTELTEYNGHCNFWGVEKPFKCAYPADSFEKLVSLVGEAKNNGAVVSVNHPCCKNCGWHWQLEGFPLDAVEVWNGPQRIDNMSALSWWHGELLKGRRLAAVGGSDFHRDYLGVTKLLAVPATRVYVQSSSSDDILAALKAGNSVITSGIKGEMLYIDCNGKTVGEETEWHDGITLSIRGENLRIGHILQVFNNDDVICSERIKNKSVSLSLEVPSRGFVRAQISYKYGVLGSALYHTAMRFIFPPDAKLPVPSFVSCLTNPIWIT